VRADAWPAVLIPVQIFVGDMHGLNTPAAPAGQGSPRWKACGRPKRGAPLLLFAIPDAAKRKNHFEIACPSWPA
jgi:cytochrome d ubiquinol oxidase subunit I